MLWIWEQSGECHIFFFKLDILGITDPMISLDFQLNNSGAEQNQSGGTSGRKEAGNCTAPEGRHIGRNPVMPFVKSHRALPSG